MAPPAFTALDFEAALERSRTNQSILIVDAMAAWCGPCRQMDATTWADAAVVARLTGDAKSFAIQVDVDEDEQVAAQLEVQAMPTLIAFASGVEHDRLVGGRGPKELLEWLDIVERGERFEDAQRAKRALAAERRRRASTLLAAKQYDDALTEYAWLWSEAPDARLVDDMRELAAAHAPAREAFAALRDAAAPKGESLDTIGTWIALNDIIGDADATLAWYAANAGGLPATRAVANLVEVTIVPLMMRRERWCEAGVALTDPRGAFLRLVESRPPDLRTGAANLVRALYAAGRDDRASDLEYEVESVDSRRRWLPHSRKRRRSVYPRVVSQADKRKQSLYFPEEMLKEIQHEAGRLDRSLSWIVQQSWKIARSKLKEFPSSTEEPGALPDPREE